VEAVLDVVLLAGRIVSADSVEEVELERPNEFASGARCVSFNSNMHINM
jgi:hypothetical protein